MTVKVNIIKNSGHLITLRLSSDESESKDYTNYNI